MITIHLNRHLLHLDMQNILFLLRKPIIIDIIIAIINVFIVVGKLLLLLLWEFSWGLVHHWMSFIMWRLFLLSVDALAYLVRIIKLELLWIIVIKLILIKLVILIVVVLWVVGVFPSQHKVVLILVRHPLPQLLDPVSIPKSVESVFTTTSARRYIANHNTFAFPSHKRVFQH